MKVTTNGTPGAKVTKLELGKETVRSLRVRADVRTGMFGRQPMRSQGCPADTTPEGP
jgi:hypothetical protein